jgi:hypothetical protein
MLVTMKFPGADPTLPVSLLRGEEERTEELWFGHGLAWASKCSDGSALQFSLLPDVPRLVARTKRRDREERGAVGFCDPYSWSAAGLMGLFISRLKLRIPATVRGRVQIELVAYPERLHSAEIARRLFSPLGYSVKSGEGNLTLDGERNLAEVFAELPALLLALDPKARLFLSGDELAEIGKADTRWIRVHPAVRAIELALQGRRTPLRFLVPSGLGFERERIAEDEFGSGLPEFPERVSTGTVSSISFTPEQ